jgi:hypothetical protein
MSKIFINKVLKITIRWYIFLNFFRCIAHKITYWNDLFINSHFYKKKLKYYTELY